MRFYVYEVEDAEAGRHLGLRHEEAPISLLPRPGERIIRFLCTKDLSSEDASTGMMAPRAVGARGAGRSSPTLEDLRTGAGRT